MSSSCVIVPLEELSLAPERKSLLPMPEMVSDLDRLCRSIAMRKLSEALAQQSGDVILSKLTRVPRMPHRKLRKLLTDNGRLSPFTVAVLNFVASYRGTIVKTFLRKLHDHMFTQINYNGLMSKRGDYYQDSSIHTLIKKALIYTEL